LAPLAWRGEPETMKVLVIVAALAVAPAAQASVHTQLPLGVTPLAYDLSITPDAKALTFQGAVKITLATRTPQRRIVLNAVDLQIAEARLDGARARVALNPKTQTASFAPAKPLSAGRHVLAIRYAGKINDGPSGFFHVDYDGGRMLATQFEPSDARRFLPVFDEPSKKAVFTVSAAVPEGQMALSNMPQTGSTPLAGGLKRVRFAPTPKMSSYLLFLGVGDLERISARVGDTTVGVVMPRGETVNGRYALESATRILAFYNDYFGLKYPLPKLDLIAAPGEVGGAMENWGAILYSQNFLVVDPRLTTVEDRQTVFNVVAHEMAHQWFGDLVTAAWWDDLWLNEGFANFMAVKAAAHLHPDWRPWLSAQAEKDQAIRLDARASTHPIVRPIASVAEAEQAFDAITYEKAESVIRMLEAYAGPDRWQAGVRAYVAAHAYGAATSDDLWAAIDKAAGKPVSRVAHDFTLQGGVPLISVDAGPGVVLRQGRFGLDDASRAPRTWRTPVNILALGHGEMIDPLVGGPLPHPLDSLRGPAIINAGQTGYFRTLYAPDAFAALAERFGDLDPADQIGLMDDSVALGLSGDAPISGYLQLVTTLPASADPLVWRDIVDDLVGLDSHFDPGPAQTAYRAWAVRRLAPALKAVGFDPKAGEADNEVVLRDALLAGLAGLGDQEVFEEARRRFEASGEDLARVPADTRAWMLASLTHSADAPLFDTLLAQARATRDPLEKEKLYEALANVRNDVLAARILDLALSDEIPSGLGPRLIQTVAAEHPDIAWRFSLEHMETIARGFDSLTRTTFAPHIAEASSDPKRADELLAYAATAIPADAQGEVKVAVARILYAAELKQKRAPEISAWIAAHGE
jgi:aminopeptidase N